MLRLTTLAAVLAAMLLPAAASAQSQDRDITLNAAAPSASWEGKQASGSGVLYPGNAWSCAPGSGAYECDNTLIHNDGPATQLKVSTAKVKGQDFDLYLYESNSQGAPLASLGASNSEGDGGESLTADIGEGAYILATIHYWAVDNQKPQATASLPKFMVPATVTPPPSEPTNPQPSPSPQPTPQPGPGAASFEVGASFGKAKLKAALSKGMPIGLRCSAACKGTASLVIDAKTAKKLKLGKKATVVGKASFAKDGGTHSMAVKFSAKARKKLAKLKSLKLQLVVQATDSAGGNARTATAKATVKR